jgi:glycosyltransferase involved in cell wall biosynthesis
MTPADRPTVLVLTRHYLPGYRAGGPIKSLSAVTKTLGHEFGFKVVTLDRDLGAQEPYTGVAIDRWTANGDAEVFYLRPGFLAPWRVLKAARSTTFDVVYQNSFWDPWFTIAPLVFHWLGLIKTTPVILAPRGEFSKGAFALKRLKKSVYLRLAKLVGLYSGVSWQASTELEKQDIIDVFPDSGPRITIALNLSTQTSPAAAPAKKEGPLKVVFLSRLVPKKNLDFALGVLSAVSRPVAFDIYGPWEDADYRRRCEALIAALPASVAVSYRGPVKAEDVVPTFAGHDLFFFPTRGENFGHVIDEALSAGCPVLLSNLTPWRDLEAHGAGWSLPLSEPGRFRELIEELADLPEGEYTKLRERALRYAALKRRDNELAVRQHRELFRGAVAR